MAAWKYVIYSPSLLKLLQWFLRDLTGMLGGVLFTFYQVRCTILDCLLTSYLPQIWESVIGSRYRFGVFFFVSWSVTFLLVWKLGNLHSLPFQQTLWIYHEIVTPYNSFRAQIWIAMLKCGVWLQILWMILVCCCFVYSRLYFKILVLENCFQSLSLSLSHSQTQSTSMWALTQTNAGTSTFMSLDSIFFVRIRFFLFDIKYWAFPTSMGITACWTHVP